MNSIEYLLEVEKIINNLTDEEFLEIFGGIFDEKQ